MNIDHNKSMKCIYCLNDKPIANFKKGEHVIPQCFGKFAEDFNVLHEIVCDDCNQYFGDNLELFLGRDSFEGFARFQYGIIAKAPLKKRRRIEGKIKTGEFKGVKVQEKGLSENGTINVKTIPQVGFFNGIKQEYIYFPMGQIPAVEYLTEKGFLLKDGMIWIIGNNDEYGELVKELKEKGIELKPGIAVEKKMESNPKTQIEYEVTIDNTIMRGMCKIVFNYLASQMGKEFVLSSNFNQIRNFIRFGEGNPKNFFLVNERPILEEDQFLERYGAKVTRGHLIMVELINEKLFSKISLFNEYTYGIILCSNYKGIWMPIKIGHHFDLETKKVTKLLSMNRKFLI